jgi:hypothetical protein
MAESNAESRNSVLQAVSRWTSWVVKSQSETQGTGTDPRSASTSASGKGSSAGCGTACSIVDHVVTLGLGVATAYAILTGRVTEATAVTLGAWTALQLARHRHLP